MKIAIFGTRGIPNHYGGFEQFAQYLSEGMCQMGHEVFVYNSHNHPYQKKKWNEVNIIHCYDPEFKLGTIGQFIYDLNCTLDSRKRNFDIILQLGYTSSSVWNWLFKPTSKLFTNMDGLEWKRTKFSRPVSLFLKYAEKLAVKHSDVLISDSIGIQAYLQKKYAVKSTYIPYGAIVFKSPNEVILNEFKLSPFKYDILIARIEPENNVKTIIDAFVKSNVKRKLVVIGNMNTKLGKKIQSTIDDSRLIFLGYVTDMYKLNNLRYYSNIYFHGHTVGGTNPSLLEAMASNALICSHKNIFNSSILNEDAIYFTNQEQLINTIEFCHKSDYQNLCSNNIDKIEKTFYWKKIISDYEQLLTGF